MFPFLDLKIFKIPMYGLCMAIGIYSAFFIAFLLIKDRQKYLDFIIVSVVSLAFGVTGAKIVYLLTVHPVTDFFYVVWKMLFTKGNPELSGGFVFYGGLIFGPIGYIIGCKIAKCQISTGVFLDEYAITIPLAHAFGRIGCFCGGCCYGILYQGFGRVIYKNPITSVPAGTGIFPVQLAEAFLLFILFWVLLFIYLNRKNLKKIPLFPVYILSYSIIRFFMEFLRGDSERGKLLIFSTSQWISLCGITIAVTWLIVSAIKKAKLINTY